MAPVLTRLSSDFGFGKRTVVSSSAASATAATISRSLRFNSADSAYLSRTPASAGNRTTWTWSGWVKRSKLGANEALFAVFSSGDSFSQIGFTSGDILEVINYQSGNAARKNTTQVFRDCSAWGHILVAATSSTLSVYFNGTEITTFTTNVAPNGADWLFNSTSLHSIGGRNGNNDQYCSLYLANIHFIDGYAYDPSYFGQTNTTTGVWDPIVYTGSYGSQGWFLNLADNSSTTSGSNTGIGKDTSGNSNYWNSNNLSVTAGSGNDSLIDTPTNGSQTDTGLGGEVVGNYATLNPLDNGGLTLSNGNLGAVSAPPAAGWVNCRHTIGMSSGKWYWEVTCTGSSSVGGLMIGILNAAGSLTTTVGANSGGYAYNATGQKYNNDIGPAYGSSFTNGDTLGIAFDADSGSITFYKNGTSQGVAYSSIPAGTYFPATAMTGSESGSMSGSINHGQRPFAYTAPSGFKALCTANLPEPTIAKGSDYMDVALYTGNGSTQTISGLNFSPDWVWFKSRSAAYNNAVFDSVRGVENRLHPNLTQAEDVSSTGLTAFNSDGFTAGSNNVNGANGVTYAAWCWDAGTTTVTLNPGDAGAGSITSQVRANASAGFSVVTFTGPASAGFGSVGHGLNAKPKFIIYARNWSVYHESVATTDYKAFILNSTSAVFDSGTPTWDVSEINSTIFTPYFRDDFGASYNANNVAYVFAPVSGYSSFGSYTGNGSTDGPFVFTGFRPRWIMFKASSTTGTWVIHDTARSTYNASTSVFYANDPMEEYTNAGMAVDVLSNGFKPRTDSSSNTNSSGVTYIYYAVAESPFAYARAR